MLACWEASPSDRPTFTNLVETLGDLLQARVQQVCCFVFSNHRLIIWKCFSKYGRILIILFHLFTRMGKIIFLWDLSWMKIQITVRTSKKIHLQSQTWGTWAQRERQFSTQHVDVAGAPSLTCTVHVHKSNRLLVDVKSEGGELHGVTETNYRNNMNQIEMSNFCFESESNSYMRGMATLQTFEEVPCKELDNSDVRKHLHFCLHAHTHTFRGGETKMDPHFCQGGISEETVTITPWCLLQDEQSDSGMVLQSDEMKHVTWNNITKNKKLSRWSPFISDLLGLDLPPIISEMAFLFSLMQFQHYWL